MGESSTGVGCDPNCKWRLAVNVLMDEKNEHLNGVPRLKTFATGDFIPTEEGAQTQRKINEQYGGTVLLSELGEECIAPCAILDRLNLTAVSDYGPAVQETLNNIALED